MGPLAGSRKFRTDFLQELPTPGTGPTFDHTVPTNITALVGKTAYLDCKVKNIGNRTVSTLFFFSFTFCVKIPNEATIYGKCLNLGLLTLTLRHGTA